VPVTARRRPRALRSRFISAATAPSTCSPLPANPICSTRPDCARPSRAQAATSSSTSHRSASSTPAASPAILGAARRLASADRRLSLVSGTDHVRALLERTRLIGPLEVFASLAGARAAHRPRVPSRTRCAAAEAAGLGR
jgi:hypothetical protein